MSERGGAWVLHAIGIHCNGRNGEGSQSCLWANSSSDCGKDGPTLQPSHWLDAMRAEFQLIEISNHVPPWGPIYVRSSVRMPTWLTNGESTSAVA